MLRPCSADSKLNPRGIFEAWLFLAMANFGEGLSTRVFVLLAYRRLPLFAPGYQNAAASVFWRTRLRVAAEHREVSAATNAGGRRRSRPACGVPGPASRGRCTKEAGMFPRRLRAAAARRGRQERATGRPERGYLQVQRRRNQPRKRPTCRVSGRQGAPLVP